MVFGRKVLRKIFGPTNERYGTWRIKKKPRINKTQEYNKSHKNIKIKLAWPFTTNAGRENGKKKVYKWKTMLTRPLGRPKTRWEDDIRNDMMKLKIKKLD